jgi:hypothetical protein
VFLIKARRWIMFRIVIVIEGIPVREATGWIAGSGICVVAKAKNKVSLGI